MEPYAEVRDAYRTFAREAAADSATFSEWAERVAADEELVDWIATLPGIKQQPNLVFAAARWHGVPAPGSYAALREALLGDDGAIRTTILERATQTNEVGRLATLVPAFATFTGPLALVEVGASAGLCLYPDRWGYRWETADGAMTLGQEPRLPCRVRGPAPLPTHVPAVASRIGIDINPLDVRDEDQVAWLRQLVWPEQSERVARLGHAVEVARHDPPRLVHGDLLTELPGAVADAADHGTVVVFHSAVIAYLAPPERERFDRLIRGLVADGACHWISNESPSVLPSVTSPGPPIPTDHPTFVLGVDGRMVAQTHGHGRSLRWTA